MYILLVTHRLLLVNWFVTILSRVKVTDDVASVTFFCFHAAVKAIVREPRTAGQTVVCVI